MSAEQDSYEGAPDPGWDEVRRLTEEWLRSRQDNVTWEYQQGRTEPPSRDQASS